MKTKFQVLIGFLILQINIKATTKLDEIEIRKFIPGKNKLKELDGVVSWKGIFRRKARSVIT